MEILIRVGVQEEPDGPFVFAPFRVIDVEYAGASLEPGQRLLDTQPLDIEKVSQLAARAALLAAQGDGRMGEVFIDESGAKAVRVQKIWKFEFWTNAVDGRPPHDAKGEIVIPEFTMNFDPEVTDGFDWAIFDAVLATFRRADDEKTIAERALVGIVQNASAEFEVPVAQLAARTGWSAEYARLVARGERLSGPVSPFETKSVRSIHPTTSDASGSFVEIDRDLEDPAALIATAMMLLGRAQAMLRPGR